MMVVSRKETITLFYIIFKSLNKCISKNEYKPLLSSLSIQPFAGTDLDPVLNRIKDMLRLSTHSFPQHLELQGRKKRNAVPGGFVQSHPGAGAKDRRPAPWLIGSRCKLFPTCTKVLEISRNSPKS